MTSLPKTELWPEKIDFGSLEITFDSRILRPRPWTVEQSLWASELLDEIEDGQVAELCSGADHIGLLSVADHDRDLVLVDSSETACEYSTINAQRAGMGDRVSVRHAWIDETFEASERFALILADPPWVPSSHVSDFPEDPEFTIDGGPDGLDPARMCVAAMSRNLSDGGAGLLQLGSTTQSDLLESWIREHPDLGLSLKESRNFEPGGVVLMLTRLMCSADTHRRV